MPLLLNVWSPDHRALHGHDADIRTPLPITD
jgi:hypothetical protein